eukprot:2420378-Rhodomonas_salina.1
MCDRTCRAAHACLGCRSMARDLASTAGRAPARAPSARPTPGSTPSGPGSPSGPGHRSTAARTARPSLLGPAPAGPPPGTGPTTPPTAPAPLVPPPAGSRPRTPIPALSLVCVKARAGPAVRTAPGP